MWDIVGVAPLADGRVAMVSAGERSVLLFERSGAFSNGIGREGRGPGEFFGPEHLHAPEYNAGLFHGLAGPSPQLPIR